MDTKQLLNDEELAAVAGGNQASMHQWSRSVEVMEVLDITGFADILNIE